MYVIFVSNWTSVSLILNIIITDSLKFEPTLTFNSHFLTYNIQQNFPVDWTQGAMKLSDRQHKDLDTSDHKHWE